MWIYRLYPVMLNPMPAARRGDVAKPLVGLHGGSVAASSCRVLPLCGATPIYRGWCGTGAGPGGGGGQWPPVRGDHVVAALRRCPVGIGLIKTFSLGRKVSCRVGDLT